MPQGAPHKRRDAKEYFSEIAYTEHSAEGESGMTGPRRPKELLCRGPRRPRTLRCRASQALDNETTCLR